MQAIQDRVFLQALAAIELCHDTKAGFWSFILRSGLGGKKIGADEIFLRRQSTSVCVDTRPLQIEV